MLETNHTKDWYNLLNKLIEKANKSFKIKESKKFLNIYQNYDDVKELKTDFFKYENGQ